MAQVSLRGVRKTFDEIPVIHGVSCDIADGELVVIVGPSGCGKSTLLRMIAGLESVSAGEIAIGERIVNDLEPAQRDIAMVFQNYALYPHMSVYDNMAYGLKMRRLPKNEIEVRVRKAAEILELAELLQRKPRQLSGGQRQRVAMGRAIVREPSAFLFDEPLSNLDAKLRGQMRIEIKKLHESLGVTSLYVTHDQIEAMTLGQRLIVMNAGVVEQIGAPMELYQQPATTFVAGFIGSPAMNFINARIDDRGAGVELRGGASLAAGRDLSSYAGREVTVGVRPEHLDLAGQDGGVRVSVAVVEELGADALVHGHIDAGGDRTDLTVRLHGARQVKTGDFLPLAVQPENLHLFDPEDGRRISL